jgi:hypothetical protein
MTRIHNPCAALLLALACVPLAPTLTTAQEQKAVMACATDVRLKCADIQRGQGRLKSCIKSMFNELSENCQAKLTEAAEVGKACAGEVRKNCAGTTGSGGGLRACVKANFAKFNDACKEEIGEAIAGKD